jgi:CSLREA domain-containing protein
MRHTTGAPQGNRGLPRFALAAIVGALAIPAAASGATISVTTTADEFDEGSRCSLREAVWSANNDAGTKADGCVVGAGSDTVLVPAGTYRLTRTGTDENAAEKGDLDVTQPLTIIHTGIQRALIDPVGDRAFQTMAGGGVTIDGFSIAGGNALSGGAILNSGALTVRNSSLYNNRAVYGGAVATGGGGVATLVNSTLSGNQAFEDGGAIDVETGGTINLSSVTIAGNVADADGNGGGSGGGAAAASSGSGGIINLRNTLLAQNTDNGGEAPDCVEFGGSIVSQGRSLIGNTVGCDYSPGPGDIANRNPRILALLDNGGPTLTRAIRKTSPAINHGSGCPATDQRGVKRRLGGACDIGAWELARCEGVVINRIGTAGSDRLLGTETADGILGLGGGDLLLGLDGNDGLCGGTGSDRLEGGPLNDRLNGGSGRDVCLAGGGRNTVRRCEVLREPGSG